jgi:hypothetical protein
MPGTVILSGAVILSGTVIVSGAGFVVVAGAVVVSAARRVLLVPHGSSMTRKARCSTSTPASPVLLRTPRG